MTTKAQTSAKPKTIHDFNQISGGSEPEPAPKPESITACSLYVIIQPDWKDEVKEIMVQMPSGLFRPATPNLHPSRGKITSIGPDCTGNLKTGDKVTFQQLSYIEVDLVGHEKSLFALKEELVIGVIK